MMTTIEPEVFKKNHVEDNQKFQVFEFKLYAKN